MACVITLTTDFGSCDAYVASMKGAILSINPTAIIIDICHSIEPQNVLQAAFILSTAYRYFPKDTIHMAVVDPGVGSQRKAIILKTPSAFFLAPDNGVLSYIIDELCPTSIGALPSVSDQGTEMKLGTTFEAIAIANPAFWRQSVSPTFHGRDIFAPVAAHLSTGVPLSEFGENIDSIQVLPLTQPYYDAENVLIGHIIHIDHFGNLITNIRGYHLPNKEIIINVGDMSIYGLSYFYAQREGTVAIIGSNNYLEISLTNGNASELLGAETGDRVKIRLIDRY